MATGSLIYIFGRIYNQSNKNPFFMVINIIVRSQILSVLALFILSQKMNDNNVICQVSIFSFDLFALFIGQCVSMK